MKGIQNGICWSSKYRTGDEKVDTQHKCLFELLNVLVDQCVDGCNTEKLHDTLEFLVNYTIQHFCDEESLQRLYNYPGYKEHKQMHEDFKIVVGDLVKRFTESGSSWELGDDVNKVIVHWLIGHIRNEDRKIGEHIKSISVGQGDGSCAPTYR